MVDQEMDIDGIGNPPEPTRQISPPPPLPSPPDPAADKGIVPTASSNVDDGSNDYVTLSDIPPVTALKMFCGYLEALAQATGDVPSTPPFRIDTENTISMAGGDGEAQGSEDSTPEGEPANAIVPYPTSSDDIGAGAESQESQQDALARRFFSKTKPPVPLEEYLSRLHRYCPMSTAIYLATSLYITRLAVTERIVPVTPRSVHRLALAGLRVAMKALEDLSYPHNRFAKVGGVTECELRRLEIGFCFLTDFDLLVDTDMLLQEAKSLREGTKLIRPTSNDIALRDSSLPDN
jgi:hypothetical protein